MAGNTKLVGFTRDKLILERWGKRAEVVSSSKTLEGVRYACSEVLPTRPTMRSGLLDLSVEYDTRFGYIDVRMNPVVADKFVKYLKSASQAGDFEDDRRELVDGVSEALESHRTYTDLSEPGL
jgi:hypothetical protein